MIGLDASSPHDPYTLVGGGFPRRRLQLAQVDRFQLQSRPTEVNSFPPKIRFFPNRVSKITLKSVSSAF
jgi:hypothetical protein